MSVVTKEEIEKIIDEAVYETAAVLSDDTSEFLACERVAALVEQRMKNVVCEWCGEDNEIAYDERIGEGWCGKCDKAIGRTTRAQYEADREGR